MALWPDTAISNSMKFVIQISYNWKRCDGSNGKEGTQDRKVLSPGQGIRKLKIFSLVFRLVALERMISTSKY